jgi:hypothetical protein
MEEFKCKYCGKDFKNAHTLKMHEVACLNKFQKRTDDFIEYRRQCNRWNNEDLATLSELYTLWTGLHEPISCNYCIQKMYNTVTANSKFRTKY